MKCLICGNENFECIHKGTRDIPNINVMRCTECNMVQLDCSEYNTEQNYGDGGMLKNTYAAIGDTVEDMSWETWVQETWQDDDRRYRYLKDICSGKSVLEFGCGNGGFLRRIRNVAASVTGIELMDEARDSLAKEGISVHKSLDEINGAYDVVCMFNVIEHLNEPDQYLKQIYKTLKNNGVFICETANANCALISKYNCLAYENFTYWSEHVTLFNSSTLEKLINRNGFITKENVQCERYSLGNHMYWLSKGKPGGHIKWTEFNDKQMNEIYERILTEMEIADTLWYVGLKDAVEWGGDKKHTDSTVERYK